MAEATHRSPERIASMRGFTIIVGVAMLHALPLAGARAQSLLDRPPNVSGNWVANPGTIQFNFLHRFMTSDAPIRKVTNFPTFLVGAGLPGNLMLGFHYATNSRLTPRFPNEWEFFGRYALIAEDRGAPLDLGGQVGYNNAAEGVDAEVSVAKRLGPARLIAAGRLLSSAEEGGDTRFAFAGGGTVRLNRFFALAGDVAVLSDRDEDAGEKTAWSAGLHVAIPGTPHTLSLQASNTNTATLQGLSRGDDETRWGFEFTVPITLARFFGGRTPPVAAGQAVPTPSGTPVAGREITTVIRQLSFPRARIEIDAGTTITWINEDPLAHTVTSTDGRFDSGLIQAGARWSYTFSTPGTYNFFCTPHPFMTGVVIVRGGT